MKLIISPALNEDTKLFRYVSFRQFFEFIETKQTSLSRIKNWPDTWEVPEARLPVQMDNGRIQFSIWNHCESMFGQCWSLNHESDAMWRIYSPQNEGVVIQTSVKKFALLEGIKLAALRPVIYYSDLKAVLDQIETFRGDDRPLVEAFLKRRAFEHEKEVRFVTADDRECLTEKLPVDAARCYINLDPLQFIEGITVDPRADDRYVEVIQKYCERVGLSTKPAKSLLYGDPYKHTRLVRRFVRVKKTEDRRN